METESEQDEGWDEMRKRFSPEYIDLIKSPEFAWLQEDHEWEPWDSFALIPQGDMGVVVKIIHWGVPPKILLKTWFFEMDTVGKVHPTDALWLPTLGQLVRMIEERLRERCGYMLTYNEFDEDEGHRRYRYYEVTPLEWMEPYPDQEPESDARIAAARLLAAVRREG